MEAVESVLSGFELKRSCGDPIQAPGRFTVSTMFPLLLNKKMLFFYNKKIFFLYNNHIFFLYRNNIGGWGAARNREIVWFGFVRSCVRARGLVVEWNFGSIPGLWGFPFPFSDHEPFPFPFGAPPPAPQPPIQL